MGLWARKPLSTLQGEDDSAGLHRHLTLGHLILMGVGGTIGAGIFVLTGTAAASYAGPGVALSFLLAGFACLCAALCYAELASMIPVSGSAYTYAYATMGEFIAWLIGWNLVLEYLFATSTIAVGWSGYFTAWLGEMGVHLPAALTTPPISFGAGGAWGLSGGIVNLPAVLAVLTLAGVLLFGIRGSARFNTIMVAIKLTVIALVIGFGATHIQPHNWTPFVPPNIGELGHYGWSGVVRAAGVVFFAYIGFDMVSTGAQEARNPRRDVPLSLLISLGVVTVLYISMCLVLTGLSPYRELNVPHPVFVAIAHAPALAWMRPLVSVGAIVGLCSAMLMTLYGQTRVFYSMGRDGLIPEAFARLHPKFRTPMFGTVVVGLSAALISGLVPIDILGELVSIGTLMAFSIVCIGVLVLRRIDPGHVRGFRAPWIGVVAPLGVVACAYMMISLPGATWIRFAIWLVLGLLVYFLYGRRRSKLAARLSADQSK